eukprot:TRINITY_DN1534_c0_g2_i1.p2 TRINITY_DN1534_c0_g2~~TRINITY_DN1534_c0_g2_i1.p2  ORF type:complete len:103 (-),score=7.08 TRINITY_DN1534_c0_g2_i1:111-419(-)
MQRISMRLWAGGLSARNGLLLSERKETATCFVCNARCAPAAKIFCAAHLSKAAEEALGRATLPLYKEPFTRVVEPVQLPSEEKWQLTLLLLTPNFQLLSLAN